MHEYTGPPCSVHSAARSAFAASSAVSTKKSDSVMWERIDTSYSATVAVSPSIRSFASESTCQTRSSACAPQSRHACPVRSRSSWTRDACGHVLKSFIEGLPELREPAPLGALVHDALDDPLGDERVERALAGRPLLGEGVGGPRAEGPQREEGLRPAGDREASGTGRVACGRESRSAPLREEPPRTWTLSIDLLRWKFFASLAEHRAVEVVVERRAAGLRVARAPKVGAASPRDAAYGDAALGDGDRDPAEVVWSRAGTVWTLGRRG